MIGVSDNMMVMDMMMTQPGSYGRMAALGRLSASRRNAGIV